MNPPRNRGVLFFHQEDVVGTEDESGNFRGGSVSRVTLATKNFPSQKTSPRHLSRLTTF